MNTSLSRMSNTLASWTQSTMRRVARRVDHPSKMDTLQTGAIIDIEAQQASVAPKVAKPSHAATPSLCTKVRSWAWPSLYAVVGAAGYTGAIFVWYQHQIAQARPLPFQLETPNRPAMWRASWQLRRPLGEQPVPLWELTCTAAAGKGMRHLQARRRGRFCERYRLARP